jgi:hypothetical protein
LPRPRPADRFVARRAASSGEFSSPGPSFDMTNLPWGLESDGLPEIRQRLGIVHQWPWANVKGILNGSPQD